MGVALVFERSDGVEDDRSARIVSALKEYGARRVVWWIRRQRVHSQITQPSDRLPNLNLHAARRIELDAKVPCQLPNRSRGGAIDVLIGLTVWHRLRSRRGGVPADEHRKRQSRRPPGPSSKRSHLLSLS